MAKKKKAKRKTRQNPIAQKAHRWRLCPLGYYFVSEHPMKTRSGKLTTRHAHCAKNPSGKDQLYYDEISEVSQSKLFQKVKNQPSPNPFDFKERGNRYDALIGGWVQYWNDIFKPQYPLDPNLVKALMASESSFNEKSKKLASKRNYANGLLQVTDKTLVSLGDEDGELLDHYLTITRKEIFDPSTNICAGVRWLFQKQKLASSKLGRPATWEETVAEYKSAITTYQPNVSYNQHTIQDFLFRYKWIQSGVKPKKEK